jgi:hypothetical protein
MSAQSDINELNVELEAMVKNLGNMDTEMRKLALQFETNEKRILHVITGKLRNSVKLTKLDKAKYRVSIGGGEVDYAIYEENRHPSIDRALENTNRQIDTLIKRI